MMVVQTNPKPGREDEFNAWYDNVHLKEVLQVPGFVAARRFELDPQDRYLEGEPFPYPYPYQYKYLCLYEVEGMTVREAWDQINSARETMDLGDGLIEDVRACFMYTPLTERLT